jgi:hypothetical protein
MEGAVFDRPAWESKVYRKGNAMTRYEQEQWRLLRKSCLERDKFTCFRCKKRVGNGRGMSAHHIMPRPEGPDDLYNLITLCIPCHDYVETNELKTLTDIKGSVETEIHIEIEETFIRPDWHAIVYGGMKGRAR